MLALALRQLDEFDEAYVAVFSTADDEAAKAAVAGLREELGEAGLVLPLVNFERFIEPLDAYVGASTFAREFSLRYLDLTPVA
jgi:predicted dinucleotide-binding enzyme